MEIRIIKSKKRRKTVQAREVGGVLEILAPAHMSDKQLEPIIKDLKFPSVPTPVIRPPMKLYMAIVNIEMIVITLLASIAMI